MPGGFEREWSKKHPGVYWIIGKAIGTGKPEKIYYLKYRRGDGKVIEEKAGRKGQGWTEAKAYKALRRRMAGEDRRTRKSGKRPTPRKNG